MLYERQRRNVYLFSFFFLENLFKFCFERWKLIDGKKKMSNIFFCWFVGEVYIFALCQITCQDATSDLLNPVDIFEEKYFRLRKKKGIFGCRDIRWFVNFNKWRRNGKNGKRKWKSGKEFYGSKIFYSSIKVSCARRRGKEKKVS